MLVVARWSGWPALVDRVAQQWQHAPEADAIPGRIQTLDEEIRNRDREIVGSERRRDNAKGIAGAARR